MGLIATIVAVSMVLLTAQVAMATVTAGGASSSPQTGGTSSGAATTSGTGKTGGEVILFAAVGVGLLGTGYLLTRKSKA
ncbi:MAG: hypothetical protein ACYCXU_05650 [Thermoleophilia bacterium]